MQPENPQVTEWKFPIFLFKHKKVESLPAFHSPILRRLIVESSWIKNISKISTQTYPCLQEYTVKFNKKLSHISLVDAPNLEKIYIKQNQFVDKGNYSEFTAILANTEFFKKYENLKEAYISGMIFSDPAQNKDEEKPILQIQQPDQNQQMIQKEEPKKSQLQKLINPKKYPKYLQNHLGIQLETPKTSNFKVQLRLNVIKILPQFGFKYIKELLCINNCVCSLQQFAKGSYPALKIIDFSQNKIQYVPRLNIPQIIKLKLSRNQIKSVDQFAAGQYPKLQQLLLSNNPLQSLPKLHTISLNQIYLCYNRLSNVDGFFSGYYPQIENLSIRNQSLKTIKEINAPNLKYLDFSGNKLESIPILNTPLLQTLILAQNNIVDTRSLKNDQIPLEYLDLQKNKIKHFHIFCTSKLKQLKLSFNPISNFDKFVQMVEFPHLQNLQITAYSEYYRQQQQYVLNVPKLRMPLIKKINFTDSPTHFQDIFFYGVYQNLKQINFGKCINLTKLYKIKAPQLVDIDIQDTKIQDITKFLSGSYPKLSNFRLPKNLKLVLDQKNNIQQLTIDKKTLKPIVPLYIQANETLRKILFSSFLTKLHLDCELIQNIEFISFLNLTHCQQLKCKNVRNIANLTKNLSKINFQQLKEIKRISIQTQQNLNILQFNKLIFQKQCFLIQNDSDWRRSYKVKDTIKWQIKGSQMASGWIKNNRKFEMVDFEKRLQGYNHRNIIQKLKNVKSVKLQRKQKFQDMLAINLKRGPALNRQRRHEMDKQFDDFDDFEDKDYWEDQFCDFDYFKYQLDYEIQTYQRNIRDDFHRRDQQTEWRSPVSIRSGWNRKPQRSYRFRNQSKIQSLAKSFFCQLQCPLAEAYLEEGHYWFFQKIGQCGGAPTFFVETIDFGAVSFMVSFGMIKVSQMGVNHFFERKNDQQTSEVCINCLIEVDRLMRQIFQIQRKPCPLNDRQYNIQSYRKMANLA